MDTAILVILRVTSFSRGPWRLRFCQSLYIFSPICRESWSVFFTFLLYAAPRGKLLWKKRTKIFEIRKSRQFFSGFWDFFFRFFSKYFPLFFSPNFSRNFLRHIIRPIIFKTKQINEGRFHANSRFKFLNFCGFYWVFPSIVFNF